MHTALPQTAPLTSSTGFSRTIAGRILLGLAATLVVAAAAHVSIPLWFTPIPLTLQPLAVLGVGLALGPADGFLAMLAYLAEGALGLPVFSPLGLGGVAQILGPSGGFLMAYPLVAALAGGVVRAFRATMPTFAAAAVACSIAVTVLFTLGAGWFMHYTGHSLEQAWVGAVAPFLPGEAIKIVVAAGMYSAIARSSRA